MQLFMKARVVVRKFVSARLVVLATAVALGGGCATHPRSAQSPTGEVNLSSATQLTDGFGRAGEAYFSPDMKWIVFQATPNGETSYQMYVAPLVNETRIGKPVRVSPSPSKNTCGFFSPDGNSLIFASTAGREPTTAPTSQPGIPAAAGYQRSSGTSRWDFPKEMEIFRADGWEGAVGAADPAKGTNLARHPLTKNDAYDAECAYSPDGEWIIFSSLRTGDAELFAMRADGSDVVRLTHAKGYDGGPFFSPDGKRVVYRSDRQGNDLLQVFVADVVRDRSGKIVGLARERRLTKDNNVNWGPYWHPDGRHIVYATSAHGHQNYELYLMRRDGSRKTRITFTDGFDGLPVFSPDGRWLMWSSKRTADRTTQVFIARFSLPAGA
jgi:TolB protein